MYAIGAPGDSYRSISTPELDDFLYHQRTCNSDTYVAQPSELIGSVGSSEESGSQSYHADKTSHCIAGQRTNSTRKVVGLTIIPRFSFHESQLCIEAQSGEE